MLKKILFQRAFFACAILSVFLPCLAGFFPRLVLAAEANSSVSANVYINEIMYDLDGSDIDWVEVYNGGNTSADLSSLKLLVSNSTSNHAIKAYSSDSTELSAGEYGIIVANSDISAFLSKWGHAGKLFTASFSLPNVSEDKTAIVELNAGDKSTPISSVSYEALLGAGGDGNSLQLLDNSWKASAPTPGAENVFAPILSGGAGDAGEGSGSSGDGGAGTSALPAIRAKIFTKNPAFAGEPDQFRAAILENSGEVVHYGKYFWNFGDGSVFEESGHPETITHFYSYPGDYAVFLEYYSSGLSQGNPDYSARIAVSAEPVKVSIKPTGAANDFAAELHNSSGYETDISGWKLSANGKIFIFPHDSVVLPGKSIVLSGKVTGFSPEDKKSLKLISDTGNLIASYPS